MLNSVFGITKKPFGKDISPKDIFLSTTFESAITKIELLIKYRGIGIITGEPGTGKSTLVRLATSKLNPKAFRILYICDTQLSDTEFLRLLAIEIGLEPPFHKSKLIRSIRSALLDLNDSQKIQPILALDEVHLLENSLIEQLRILSNFYMDSWDILTTILIGQKHFLSKLSLNLNLSMKQRISYLIKVSPLSCTETINYINHQLKLSGIQHQVFSNNGLNAIFQASSGIPREINRIAFTALCIAAQNSKNTVSDDILTQAILEMELKP